MNAARRRANSVRIIGGRWRSQRLRFPALPHLRPTPDRVRETVFNWLGQTLAGERCLDLFAGSGALGFEALSRGAGCVVFVESDPAALRALKENAQRLGVAALNAVRADALEFLRRARAQFDLVFVDPPYRLGLQAPALALLPRLLSSGARVYVESAEDFDPPSGWRTVRRGRAGGVHFQLLERNNDDHGGLSGHV